MKYRRRLMQHMSAIVILSIGLGGCSFVTVKSYPASNGDVNQAGLVYALPKRLVKLTVTGEPPASAKTLASDLAKAKKSLDDAKKQMGSLSY